MPFSLPIIPAVLKALDMLQNMLNHYVVVYHAHQPCWSESMALYMGSSLSSGVPGVCSQVCCASCASTPPSIGPGWSRSMRAPWFLQLCLLHLLASLLVVHPTQFSVCDILVSEGAGFSIWWTGRGVLTGRIHAAIVAHNSNGSSGLWFELIKLAQSHLWNHIQSMNWLLYEQHV